MDVDRYCRMLHDVYEVAAKRNGWQTQETTRVFFDDLPEANKATMREAVRVVLRQHRSDVLREAAQRLDRTVPADDPQVETRVRVADIRWLRSMADEAVVE